MSQQECEDSETGSDTTTREAWDDFDTDEAVLAHADALHLCGGETEDVPCYCECHYGNSVDLSSEERYQLCKSTQEASDGDSQVDSEMLCRGADDEGVCYCTCHPSSWDDETLPEHENEPNGDAFLNDEEQCWGHNEAEEAEEYQDEDEYEWELNDELYDSEERIGMLYEPVEPPILSTCKEIRSACLPVYYYHNAFSWRFLYLDIHVHSRGSMAGSKLSVSGR